MTTTAATTTTTTTSQLLAQNNSSKKISVNSTTKLMANNSTSNNNQKQDISVKSITKAVEDQKKQPQPLQNQLTEIDQLNNTKEIADALVARRIIEKETVNKNIDAISSGSNRVGGGGTSTNNVFGRQSKILSVYREDLKIVNFTDETKNLLARSAIIDADDDSNEHDLNSEALTVKVYNF